MMTMTMPMLATALMTAATMMMMMILMMVAVVVVSTICKMLLAVCTGNS